MLLHLRVRAAPDEARREPLECRRRRAGGRVDEVVDWGAQRAALLIEGDDRLDEDRVAVRRDDGGLIELDHLRPVPVRPAEVEAGHRRAVDDPEGDADGLAGAG